MAYDPLGVSLLEFSMVSGRKTSYRIVRDGFGKLTINFFRNVAQ